MSDPLQGYVPSGAMNQSFVAWNVRCELKIQQNTTIT